MQSYHCGILSLTNDRDLFRVSIPNHIRILRISRVSASNAYTIDAAMFCALQPAERPNWFQRAHTKERETNHRVIPNQLIIDPSHTPISVTSPSCPTTVFKTTQLHYVF